MELNENIVPEEIKVSNEEMELNEVDVSDEEAANYRPIMGIAIM